MREPKKTITAELVRQFKAGLLRKHRVVISDQVAAHALRDAMERQAAGGPLPPLDQERSEKILKVLEPFLDTGDSRSAPGWAVEIYRLLALEPAPVPAVGAQFECVDEGLTGTAPAPVKRVEREDDGSLTVVLDYWPSPDQEAAARDAARWRHFASSPQTALMLGSELDPNAVGIDWRAECDRLLDGGVPGTPGPNR